MTGMLRRFLFLAAWSLAATPTRPSALFAEEQLPAAPAGFTWKKLDSIKAQFLVPDGWFFKEEQKDDARAFFISRESIEKGGEFQTGLTINVVKLKKDPAPDRAKLYIAEISQQGEIQKLWQEGERRPAALRRAPPRHEGSPALHRARARDRQQPHQYPLHPQIREPGCELGRGVEEGEVMLRDFALDDEI